MYVKLPDGTEVFCRKCTCGYREGHTLTCDFYVDYSAALTDFVYGDDSGKDIAANIPKNELN